MTQRKPGRPPRTTGDDASLRFGLTSAEHKRIARAAGNYPLATWCRSVVLTAAKRKRESVPPVEIHELLAAVREMRVWQRMCYEAQYHESRHSLHASERKVDAMVEAMTK